MLFDRPHAPHFCFFSCSVAYPSEQMMFKWKEKDPVMIFNDQLAEFDIVNINVTTKNITYVSGEVWTVLNVTSTR